MANARTFVLKELERYGRVLEDKDETIASLREKVKNLEGEVRELKKALARKKAIWTGTGSTS